MNYLITVRISFKKNRLHESIFICKFYKYYINSIIKIIYYLSKIFLRLCKLYFIINKKKIILI